MSRIGTKLVRANSRRRTRLHTEDGRFLPLTAWPEAVRAVFVRLRRSAPTAPWIVPSAVRFLAAEANARWHVLELGAGASTTWWAERCAYVKSFEDDVNWFATVSASVRACGCENVDLVLIDGGWRSVTDGLEEASYDIVVVDFNEKEPGERVDVLRSVSRHIRPGGYAVLDDADRTEYAIPAEMTGWRARSFVGIKSRPLLATETKVLQRPAPDAP